MTLNELVQNFTTTPFLFVGSGITRRYLDLPNWKGLLSEFVTRIDNSPFAYAKYENRAKEEVCTCGLLPKIAELLEIDFNRAWFNNNAIHKCNESFLSMISSGNCSPFKAEIASYIQDHLIINTRYEKEIKELQELSKKSISGIITTNYDTFLEKNTDGYTTYVGQEELVFSAIQGIAEIYKIHGSISRPETIVLTEKDYLEFEQKEAYLASKLLTIFMEYPIVFIGYSITDKNVRSILQSIVSCLSEKNIQRLQDRFVFVEYDEKQKDVEIDASTFVFEEKTIPMTYIKLSDFSLLYKALSRKKAALPIKMFRLFKQEFYNFVITNTPTATLRVSNLDNPNLEDSDLVLAIGKASTFGLKGIRGITLGEWYRNIIMDDLDISPDDLLRYAYPNLAQGYGKIPFHKLLRASSGQFDSLRELAKASTFDKIISESFQKSRKSLPDNKHGVQLIWTTEEYNEEKKLRSMAYLLEDEIDVDALEKILKDIFSQNPNILEDKTINSNTRSHIRRLIRIYDFLKFGKEKNT